MPKKKMFFICCVIGDENDKSLLNFPTGKVWESTENNSETELDESIKVVRVTFWGKWH
jgi:hypothetical protein